MLLAMQVRLLLPLQYSFSEEVTLLVATEPPDDARRGGNGRVAICRMLLKSVISSGSSGITDPVSIS